MKDLQKIFEGVFDINELDDDIKKSASLIEVPDYVWGYLRGDSEDYSAHFMRNRVGYDNMRKLIPTVKEYCNGICDRVKSLNDKLDKYVGEHNKLDFKSLLCELQTLNKRCDFLSQDYTRSNDQIVYAILDVIEQIKKLDHKNKLVDQIFLDGYNDKVLIVVAQFEYRKSFRYRKETGADIEYTISVFEKIKKPHQVKTFAFEPYFTKENSYVKITMSVK